ncbi:MAG: cytochrome c [Phycisphaerales bacterium]
MRTLLLAIVVGAAFLASFIAVGDDPPREQETTATPPAAPSPTLPALNDDQPREYPGLHNVVAYAEGFVSGSAPEGDAGFDTLRALGIRTIISVDGAEPEVDKATSRGMRYVHLPIGYDGFDDARKAELVRAVRDLPRPIYIHCHHGKHRSAGAAGTIAVSLGWLTNDAAVARMKVSGTAPNYTGLYSCTQKAAVLEAATIDAASAEFPAVTKPKSMVKAMVEIEEVVDHLKLIEKAGWKAPGDHPDLVPAAEAGRLADLLRNLDGDAGTKKRPPEFATLLAEKAKVAQALEDLLVAPQTDAAKATEQFKLVNASCKECHRSYRD